jgi:acyl-CoA reductase-like NAD-dependent aldehyde dehydrogenase
MFEGHDVSSMSGYDYMITGLTLAGQQAARQEPAQAEMAGGAVIITQHGGGTINLGQVNTGQVRGNIETHLKSVTGSSAKDFTEAIRAFAEAVAKDAALQQAQRDQILEDVDYLAEEAKKPVSERRPTLLARLLGGMPKALTAAESAKTAWDTFGPVISGFFGQPGAK